MLADWLAPRVVERVVSSRRARGRNGPKVMLQSLVVFVLFCFAVSGCTLLLGRWGCLLLRRETRWGGMLWGNFYEITV